jgi:hypothetical protein
VSRDDGFLANSSLAQTSRSFRRALITLAAALGVAFGSYGIASAATGSGTTTTTTTTARPSTSMPAAQP